MIIAWGVLHVIPSYFFVISRLFIARFQTVFTKMIGIDSLLHPLFHFRLKYILSIPPIIAVGMRKARAGTLDGTPLSIGYIYI